MNLSQLTQSALALIQQAAPDMAIAADAITLLGTMGKAAVKVIRKGRQLVTYLISRSEAEAEGATPDETITLERPDVAILVDLNRRMLQDVARYLDEQKIDADLIVVTNDPAYSDKVKFIDPGNPAEWTELVQEFTATMNAIKHQLGGARIHIFLSTPLPLAFGLGCVWGTVDQATIYHWEKQTYYPAMRISRELRQ